MMTEQILSDLREAVLYLDAEEARTLALILRADSFRKAAKQTGIERKK
jgi:hypothetical protein